MIQPKTAMNARILIIDDEEQNNVILREFLEMEGYTNVQSTTIPVTGLNLLTRETFDLILLDIVMPILNGFDLLKAIQDKSHHGPIIILSAKNDENTRNKALKTSLVRDFLIKPFKRQELLLRVKNLLELHLTQIELKQQNSNLNQLLQESTIRLKDQKIRLKNQYEKSQKQHKLILATQIDLMHRLGMTGEIRDDETGMHVKRVSQYSKQLALAINLSNYQADAYIYAAPMHDIGKVGIRDDILLKPGKFTAEERQIMNAHTIIGAKILANPTSKLVEMGRIIALTHHEKWNGNGYPNGLKGKNIPLPGRIVAVADVYDALTSKRPYKSAWKEEQALDLIKKERGEQFDPELVNAFFRILPQIHDIKKSYQELKSGENHA